MPEPPKKRFLSENVIFRGLRLSLGHFGQQVPESLKALIFSMGILEGVKWLISQVDYNGPKQQGISYTVFEMH